MNQTIEFKTQCTGKTQQNAVGTAIGFVPAKKLAVDCCVFVEKAKMSEVEYKQASHSYRTAYKAQESSFVIINPIVELEAEENCPAQELNQRE